MRAVASWRREIDSLSDDTLAGAVAIAAKSSSARATFGPVSRTRRCRPSACTATSPASASDATWALAVDGATRACYAVLELDPMEVSEARWVTPAEFLELEPTFEGDREFVVHVLPSIY